MVISGMLCGTFEDFNDPHYGFRIVRVNYISPTKPLLIVMEVLKNAIRITEWRFGIHGESVYVPVRVPNVEPYKPELPIKGRQKVAVLFLPG